MLFPNPRACSCLLLTAVLAGCSMPKTATYEPGVGRKFCSDIANHAQLVSTQEMGVGVFLLTVGGASLTASGVLATISANSENNRQLLGMVLLSRSDEASALAAAANTAIALSETDEDAYRDCVLAKAAWVGSRADATALARKALEDEREKQHKHDDEAAEEEQKKIDAEAGTKDEAPKESEDAP